MTIIHARRKVDVERAFFARYLFVRDDGQGLPVIRTAPGVSHLPRRGLDPIMVPQEIVEHLEQRVASYNAETSYLKNLPLADLYEPGQVVRVTDGPFASFNAVFERQVGKDNHRRAQVMVQIFGRTSPVELEYSQFEAA